MVAMGQASAWERFCVSWQLIASPTARKRYKKYVAVSQVLEHSLGDPDDVISINLRPRHLWPAKNAAMLMLLAALVTVAFLEWRSYTMPAVNDLVQYVSHRCNGF
jgi:hypothetical protein